MTVYGLTCDICGCYLPAPASGVRFVYDPGVPELRDDSGLACGTCWDSVTRQHDLAAPAGRCAACGRAAGPKQSLRVRRFDDPRSWRLCAAHAVVFLNSLCTVEPKLDPRTFRFPAAG